MFYSLASTRKIGAYTQMVTSYQKHTPSASESGGQSNVMTAHNSWRTLIAEFDSASWETGSLKWDTMVALDDHKTDNNVFTNKAADVSVTIVSEVSGNVENTSFALKNVGYSDFVTEIQSKYLAMTGKDLTNASVKLKTFITNVVLNLHTKESE